MCKHLGCITRRDMMPLNPIIIVEIFYVWGIDFIGPFSVSFGNLYMLLAIDYVFKWVEAIPNRNELGYGCDKISKGEDIF